MTTTQIRILTPLPPHDEREPGYIYADDPEWPTAMRGKYLHQWPSDLREIAATKPGLFEWRREWLLRAADRLEEFGSRATMLHLTPEQLGYVTRH